MAQNLSNKDVTGTAPPFRSAQRHKDLLGHAVKTGELRKYFALLLAVGLIVKTDMFFLENQPTYPEKNKKINFAQKNISTFKKSRIRETLNLSTDADSSTDAIGGWTKNTLKYDFFEKRKKSSKTQKLKNI